MEAEKKEAAAAGDADNQFAALAVGSPPEHFSSAASATLLSFTALFSSAALATLLSFTALFSSAAFATLLSFTTLSLPSHRCSLSPP
jgi:hypothetical protein